MNTRISAETKANDKLFNGILLKLEALSEINKMVNESKQELEELVQEIRDRIDFDAEQASYEAAAILLKERNSQAILDIEFFESAQKMARKAVEESNEILMKHIDHMSSQNKEQMLRISMLTEDYMRSAYSVFDK